MSALLSVKGLTAGYLPMAATLTTERVWNAFLGTHAQRRTFFHGHTYGGNPLAAAVGLASLDVFSAEGVLAGLPAKIARLGQHADRLAQERTACDAPGQAAAPQLEQAFARRHPGAVVSSRSTWTALGLPGRNCWSACASTSIP